MSKKMKVWTAGVLGIMMVGLVCVNVYALDDKDVIGTWYANSLTMDGLSVFHPTRNCIHRTLYIRGSRNNSALIRERNYHEIHSSRCGGRRTSFK